MSRLSPYIIMAVGILGDYLTSVIGLSLGFYETHAAYSPWNALLIFSLAIFICDWACRASKFPEIAFKLETFLAFLSWFGMLSNLVVLSGISPTGLKWW